MHEPRATHTLHRLRTRRTRSASSGRRTWPPDSPYVADTMPTRGFARDDSPPSAAYPPVAHPPPPPALQNLPPPHNTHSTPRPRSVEHTANL